jgi:two-component system copper resistance phosphate regulon response regulator CusR
MRVLVAEDEPNIARHVKRGLEEASYAVDTVENGDDAVWMATTTEYDVLVMDVMMPIKDGFRAIKEIRKKGVQTPAIMLTSRGEIEDRVRGLDAGADDYLTKPFSIPELLARIRALLRRHRGTVTNSLRVDDLELDLVSHRARRGGRDIELTNREFALLEFLMAASPRPVSKTAILEHVWGHHFDSGTNVVNVYIRHLRDKIEADAARPLLHTVRGLGFVLKKPD